MTKIARFLLVPLLLWGTSASAVVLSLEPADTVAGPGDMVSLDLVISDLGAGVAPSLGAFSVDVLFDPTALSFSSYALGPFLGDLGIGEALDISFGDLGGGIVNIAELSFLLDFELDTIQPDSFTLATLDFMVDVLAPGSSTSLGFGFIELVDAGFPPSALDVAPEGALIRSPRSPVPEPGTLALLGLGLAGLGFARRRKA